MAEILRRRTPGERDAYLAGYEAGVASALRHVERLNFTDVARRVRVRVDEELCLIGVLDPAAASEGGESR